MHNFKNKLGMAIGALALALVAGSFVSAMPANAAGQSGDLTIKLNYERTDKNYVDAKAWVWCKDGAGTWGTGVYKATAGKGSPATGSCLDGAYVSLHTAVTDLVSTSSTFTITGASGITQLGIIMYKAAGDANCCGTRDAQSTNDRPVDLVAVGTEVTVTDSAAAINSVEYAVPTPSPTDTATPNPTDTSNPEPTPTDTPNPEATAPGAPIGVVASPGNAQVTLSWPAVADAITYTVYRADRPGEPLVTQAETTYVDSGLTNGTQYSYTVVASNDVGDSGPSVEVVATPVPPLIAAKVPSITSFSQSKSTKRGVGTVTVIGKNLSGATVKVGTLTATVNKKSSTATKLVFTIPAKASATTKGKFTVTLAGKSATSKSTLKITLK